MFLLAIQLVLVTVLDEQDTEMRLTYVVKGVKPGTEDGSKMHGFPREGIF